jgi:hypothetical protein
MWHACSCRFVTALNAVSPCLQTTVRTVNSNTTAATTTSEWQADCIYCLRMCTTLSLLPIVVVHILSPQVTHWLLLLPPFGRRTRISKQILTKNFMQQNIYYYSKLVDISRSSLSPTNTVRLYYCSHMLRIYVCGVLYIARHISRRPSILTPGRALSVHFLFIPRHALALSRNLLPSLLFSWEKFFLS